ncbi:MAG: zinc ribbon domain-containing protein, partial [Gemmatimonadota bacterium]
MPTYEYVCEACGHEFERFQKISADPVRKCPECGRRKVRRMISAGG